MSHIKNYQMETHYFDKDVELDIPFEKFSEEQE